MGNMIPLQLAVILVSIGQLYIIIQYILWPHAQRITHCPWCWKALRLTRHYPRQWSSTICAHHERQILAQAAARRLARQNRCNVLTPAHEIGEVPV